MEGKTGSKRLARPVPQKKSKILSFFSSVFTPPHNKYGATTLGALDAINFTIISRCANDNQIRKYIYRCARLLGLHQFFGRIVSHHGGPASDYNLRKCSGCVSILKTDSDQASESSNRSYTVKSHEELAVNSESCESRFDFVGIMLHDWAIETAQESVDLEKSILYVKNDSTPL